MKKFNVTKIIVLLLCTSFVANIQAQKRKTEGLEPEERADKRHEADSSSSGSITGTGYLPSSSSSSSMSPATTSPEAPEQEKTGDEGKEEKKLLEMVGQPFVQINRTELHENKLAVSQAIAQLLVLSQRPGGINTFDWLTTIRLNKFSFDKKQTRFMPDAHAIGQSNQYIQLCALSREIISGKIPVIIFYTLTLFVTPDKHVRIVGGLDLFYGHDEKIFENMNMNFLIIGKQALSSCRYYVEPKTIHIDSIATHKDERRKGLSSFLITKLIDTMKKSCCIFTANAANEKSAPLFEKLGFTRTDEIIQKKYGLDDDITHVLTTHMA